MLFVVTNLAIMMLLMVVFMVLSRVFGLGAMFDEAGINLTAVVVVSLVFGMGGAFISLPMVIALSTIFGHTVDKALFGNRNRVPGIGYFVISIERLQNRL